MGWIWTDNIPSSEARHTRIDKPHISRGTLVCTENRTRRSACPWINKPKNLWHQTWHREANDVSARLINQEVSRHSHARPVPDLVQPGGCLPMNTPNPKVWCWRQVKGKPNKVSGQAINQLDAELELNHMDKRQLGVRFCKPHNQFFRSPTLQNLTREKGAGKTVKAEAEAGKVKPRQKINALHEKKRKGTKIKLPTSSFNPPPTFLLVPHFSFKYLTRASSVLAPS